MTLIRDADRGTPASSAFDSVTLTIDGESVTVPAGTSIMRAASLAGTDIPKLCATDSMKAFGSCRICLIEIDGRADTPASCTTPVADGMAVVTKSDRLERLRKGVMELYLSDHPAPEEATEMREMAEMIGVAKSRYLPVANHLGAPCDTSNPYFDFDPSLCIVCSRCVRACDEVQGTFALTISGRGFGSHVSASQEEPFLASECVSCGACVTACPTGSLQEKAVKAIGLPESSTITTCAYCGVGCTFKAEMKGEEVVRMVPWKEGKANRGHSCVKGRFAWGYATHKERILEPMIRGAIDEPWQIVSWDEAIAHTASEFRRLQATHGKHSVGGVTSSRCTNEETFLVQKLVRAGFGNNNVDTCARVCHSPTGYGLKTTFGTSAGTQDFDSVEQADVMIVIGANPTDGHPVFASRMKRRMREGARLIVIDPRRIDMVRTPHIEAEYHLPLKPGTNVAVLTAMAHVVVTEGLADEAFIRERCDLDEYARMGRIRRPARTFARGDGALYRRPRRRPARRRAALRDRRQRRDLLRARRHRAQPGHDHGDGDRQSRHGDGQYRPPRRRRESAAGARTTSRAPATWAASRTSFRATAMSPTRPRATCSRSSGARRSTRARPSHPQHARRRRRRRVQGRLHPGRGHPPVRSQHARTSRPASSAMECVVVHDLFLNETANYAHVFLPGSTFLEKDGTFTNAERRIQPVRKVMRPKNGYADWEITQLLANAMGLGLELHPRRADHGRDRGGDADLRRRLLRPARRARLDPVAVQREGAGRHADHARRPFRARQGQVRDHRICPDRREERAALSAAADHRADPQPV